MSSTLHIGPKKPPSVYINGTIFQECWASTEKENPPVIQENCPIDPAVCDPPKYHPSSSIVGMVNYIPTI